MDSDSPNSPEVRPMTSTHRSFLTQLSMSTDCEDTKSENDYFPSIILGMNHNNNIITNYNIINVNNVN